MLQYLLVRRWISHHFDILTSTNVFIETWYVQNHLYPFSSRFSEIGMFGVRNHLYKLFRHYKLQANIITPYCLVDIVLRRIVLDRAKISK